MPPLAPYAEFILAMTTGKPSTRALDRATASSPSLDTE